MPKYSAVYYSIWKDKKFLELGSQAQILFLYLFTNESVTLTGIYQIEPEYIDMKFKGKFTFSGTMDELLRKNMVKWDPDTYTVFVINRFAYLPNNVSRPVIAGALKELKFYNHPFNQEFISKYSKHFENKNPEFASQQGEVNLLTGAMIESFKKLNYSQESIKKFYLTKGYKEVDVDILLGRDK